MPKHSPHIEQALAELELAEEFGSEHAALAASKRLAAAGHKRAASAKQEPEARSAPPRGRSSRPTATT